MSSDGSAGSGGPLAAIKFTGGVIWDLGYLITTCILAYSEPIYRLFVKPPLKNLDNHIILVTGAGAGMGREMCLYLAECCPQSILVCWDINKNDNDRLVSELKSMGVQATGYQIDLTDRKKVENLCSQVIKEVGDVTVVINNAGIMPSTNFFLKLNPDEFERMYQLNVLSHYWILQAFLPKMMENNEGHVVTMSSMAGLVPSKCSSVYCGTKYAVRGFIETLMLEMKSLGLDIKFTTVFPSQVNTALLKDTELTKTRYPYPARILEPREAAVEIIDSFRRNQEFVYLPHILGRGCSFLNNVLPQKVSNCLRDIFDFHLIPTATTTTPTLQEFKTDTGTDATNGTAFNKTK